MDENRQSAAKPLLDGERSTTIPEGSTGLKSGKQPIYLNVIYKITNVANNKIYIGSASFYDKRKGTHISKLVRGTHKNPMLQNAWNKYGRENFFFEVIEQCKSQNELLKREQFWIDKTKCYEKEFGYNISKTAGSNLGNKMSELSKKKIGQFHKGKKFSKERIEKLKKEVTERQGVKVNVFDSEMKLIYEFDSISETSRTLGVSIACVSKQCTKGISGKRKLKYIFKYKDIV